VSSKTLSLAPPTPAQPTSLSISWTQLDTNAPLTNSARGCHPCRGRHARRSSHRPRRRGRLPAVTTAIPVAMAVVRSAVLAQASTAVVPTLSSQPPPSLPSVHEQVLVLFPSIPVLLPSLPSLSMYDCTALHLQSQLSNQIPNGPIRSILLAAGVVTGESMSAKSNPVLQF